MAPARYSLYDLSDDLNIKETPAFNLMNAAGRGNFQGGSSYEREIEATP
jgi:hypothetical protein